MRRRTAGLKGVQGEEGVSPNSLADFFHWIPDLVKASSAKTRHIRSSDPRILTRECCLLGLIAARLV